MSGVVLPVYTLMDILEVDLALVSYSVHIGLSRTLPLYTRYTQLSWKRIKIKQDQI